MFRSYVVCFMPVYLASSVAMVACLHLHGSILCREGLWRQGLSTAEREREGTRRTPSNFQANLTNCSFRGS